MSDSIERKRSSQPLPAGYPNPLLVTHDGRQYKLTWHPASGRYRLRVFGYGERTYGPDPGKAMIDCLAELPLLLSGQLTRPETPVVKSRPQTIAVKAFGQTWTLRYHKSGYRTNRGLANYIYAGHDPLAAPDIFKEKLLPLIFPEAAPVEPVGPAFVTFETALDEWLLTKSERVSKSRYDSYNSGRNVLVEEATDQMKKLPLDDVSARQWAALQTRMYERQKAHSSRAATCRIIQEMKQLVFDRHDLKLSELAGYFDPNAVNEGRITLAPVIFEIEEIHALLKTANAKWRAMILWGVNGAFEPLDLAALLWSHIDTKSGWFSGHRMKKRRGAKKNPFRRFQLWPETTEAVEAWRKQSNSKIVFPKDCGSHYKTRKSNDSAFSADFNVIQEAAKVKVSGRGFYGLRHSCAHFMGKAPFKDQMGVDVVMGHTYGLDHVYDPHTDDRHVAYVCEYARLFLFEGRIAADKYAATAIASIDRGLSLHAADEPQRPGKVS